MAKVEPGGVIDRTLSASPLLDDRIIDSLAIGEDGRVSFQPELDRIARITTKIAFGLFCLKYGPGPALPEFSTPWISGPEQQLPPHLVAAQWVWPGVRRKRWTTVQEDIFGFLFAKGWTTEDPPLYCMIELHRTIFAAVRCPAPVGRRKESRLRAKPWA